jgi:hypothetical protein
MQTVYRNMEDAGRILRGRFVEGMGGTQFAERLTIDRLRELSTTQPERSSRRSRCLPAIRRTPSVRNCRGRLILPHWCRLAAMAR